MMPRLALSLPFAVAMLLTSAFTVADIAGVRPWSRPVSNPSEAVRESDVTALRLMHHAGASLTEGHRLRDGADRERVVTPIEVATLMNDPRMIGLLERLGVEIDDVSRRRLLCLAREVGAADSLAALTREGLSPTCDPSQVTWIR
jgi:hypothetical protein